METINMSRLHLSSINNNLPNESSQKPSTDVKFDTIALMDPDDDFHCEYWEDIWENLLQQEKEKPVIHFQSPQLKFRGALVQRVRAVCRALGLSLSSLHAAVALLDLFMDTHVLRDDRLTHVALACLSLAAKSEEKLSCAPTLRALARAGGVQLCADTFRQLEWMVGQHVRWRLLAPTPVTFAALLARYVVTDADLLTRHPKFVRRFRRDGARLLEAYLDLTLSNVRLKSSAACTVACACVAAARAALGLRAWPAWLAARARTPHAAVAPVALLLQRMMKVLKTREMDSEDQGYGSAKTSPNITPSASPKYTSTGSSCQNDCQNSSRQRYSDSQNVPSNCQRHGDSQDVASNCQRHSNSENISSDSSNKNTHPYLELDDSKINANVTEYYLPKVESCHKINTHEDYMFCRNARLVQAYGEPSVAVKRGLDSAELDRKRYRLTAQMSQVVL